MAESPSTAVATMNFIVFVDEDDNEAHRRWVLERTDAFVAKHPARTIVLDSTGARGDDEIGAERITLAVKRRSYDAIVARVSDLVINEVATILWWSGSRLLQSRTFRGLAGLASCVLVDSSGSARDLETIRELSQLLAQTTGVCLHDLAFMRLLPWQEMIAEFFDDPSLRDDLFSINELQIESGSEAEAFYLAGWLASRLSWEPAGRGKFRARGRTIAFKKVSKGDARRVRSVRLCSDDSVYLAELSPDDPQVVCLQVTGAKARQARCAPLAAIDNLSLIERAILTSGRDRIFETSLLTVRELLA